MTTIGVVDVEQDRLGTGGTEVETKMRALRKPILNAHFLSLQKHILIIEQEIDKLVMEKLN